MSPVLFVTCFACSARLVDIGATARFRDVVVVCTLGSGAFLPFAISVNSSMVRVIMKCFSGSRLSGVCCGEVACEGSPRCRCGLAREVWEHDASAQDKVVMCVGRVERDRKRQFVRGRHADGYRDGRPASRKQFHCFAQGSHLSHDPAILTTRSWWWHLATPFRRLCGKPWASALEEAPRDRVVLRAERTLWTVRFMSVARCLRKLSQCRIGRCGAQSRHPLQAIVYCGHLDNEGELAALCPAPCRVLATRTTTTSEALANPSPNEGVGAAGLGGGLPTRTCARSTGGGGGA